MSIFAVLSNQREVTTVTSLGLRLARAFATELVVAVVEGNPSDRESRTYQLQDTLPDSASKLSRQTARELRRLLSSGDFTPPPAAAAEPPDEHPIELIELCTSYPLRDVLAAQGEAQAELLLVAKSALRKPSGGASLARKLFTAAPCRTLLVGIADADSQDSATDLSCQRVLVPTAGGHHAKAALSIGDKLIQAEQGELRALNVQAPILDLAWEVGQRSLAKSLAAAGIADSAQIRRQVELADRVDDGIRKALEDPTDLLLLGASSVGQLRRQLFGTVPERLLSGHQALVVGVVRERWRLHHRLRTRLGRWLDLTIPQMTREERVRLFETLQSGSLWRFDFFALIGLSTAIATLGLLQSSAAVVIGAMLVAPLMTPILGAGLGLVQGNLPLLRDAAKALLYGYLTALVIGIFLGAVVPLPELTAELLARGGPTLLDLGVAWLSGIAAAYCLGRPGLVAALPGVAIAAALVPPIATTGVSIAQGQVANARGAALLFGTNVVAIVLGAGLAFYAAGVRGKRGASGQTWVRLGFLALLVAVAVLAMPLGSELLSGLRAGEPQSTLETPLRQRLERAVASTAGARIVGMQLVRQQHQPVLEVAIESPRPVSTALVAELGRLARASLGQDCRLRVRHYWVRESPPPRGEIP